MDKKPNLTEIQDSKETVKRWYFVAKERGKTSAMKETRKIWDLLDFLEQTFRS